VHARIFAQDELLERASSEVVEEDSSLGQAGAPPKEGLGPEGSEGMKPEELKEYLRRLNPEDFGRFTP
jgi:hypothetical protein